MKQNSEWEQKCLDALAADEEMPGLVITQHDRDGAPVAELVIKRGWRLVVDKSPEYFADGSIAARFTMEPMLP
jgi:hypothetical protein